MLGIIVPFKPKSQSPNWIRDNELLSNTIRCILNQSSNDFRVYVVYTDIPINIIQNDKIIYLQYPYPFEYYEEIKDADKFFHLFKRKLFMARFYDKGKKVTFASNIAKKDGCNYLMNVDADDLISSRIVKFVKQNNRNGEVDGWYIPKGYVWVYGSKIILKQNQMQNFNGSTHIIREDIIKIPDFSSTDWNDYSLFASHGWIRERLKEHSGKILEPIPFRGAVYVAHENNDSKITDTLSLTNWKGLAKKIIRGRLLTRTIREEFHIQ